MKYLSTDIIRTKFGFSLALPGHIRAQASLSNMGDEEMSQYFGTLQQLEQDSFDSMSGEVLSMTQSVLSELRTEGKFNLATCA